MCSLVVPFEGVATGVESVTTQGHVDLVAVASVPRDDVLQQALPRARYAPEDEERRVQRRVEPSRGDTVGGLAPQGLLRRVDAEAVDLLQDLVQRAAEVLAVEVGKELLRVPAVLQGHGLPVGEPDAVHLPGG